MSILYFFSVFVVANNTTYEAQYCSCTHLTSFASTWIVPPTPLDFNYIFANAGFAQNLTIYITTIVIYVVFIFILLWARRRDRKDLLKLGVTPLVDNNPAHNYYYEIVVMTGQRKAGGTDSKVSFIMSGENEETSVRDFEDDKRKIFRRGASDRFLMAVPGPLGTLNYMRIWHDNSGKGKMQGWYVKYIAIRDIQTRERFYFIVNQWFSVVEDDGQIDRLIPVAGREQMQNFSHLFSNHTRKNFNDGHLWFSIIGRPPGSRFTRVQRAACCLMFLWLEMLVNIMFYQVAPPAAAKSPIEIGPLSLSPAQISIGVQANLIVFPVSLLVVQFFRKSRPRNMRQSRIKVAALANKPKRKLRRRPRKTAPANYSKLEDFASPSRIVLEESNKPPMMINPTAGTRAEPSLVVPPVPGTYDETAVQGGQGAGYLGGETSPTPQGDATVLIQPDKPKRRKKFSFPWWCVIVAWIVLLLSMAAATTITIFYGIQFGNTETSEWLCSIIISFVFGIFLTQPIKILLLATFIACIVKSPNADEDTEMEEDEEEFDLGNDEEYLHTVSGSVSTKKRKLPYKPPDPEALERAREQRVKEIKMYSIFREIFFYVVYLWVVLVISYGNSDPSAYRMQEDFFNELVIGPDSVHSFNKLFGIDFLAFLIDGKQINSHASYWAYLHSTLVPAIYPQTWYNGDPSPELDGFLKNQNAFILGYPVLRQARVKMGECEVVSQFTNIVPECNVAYSFGNSDEGDYGPGWTLYNTNVTDRPQYNFTAWDEIESYPVLGRQAVYAGGGYLAKLQGSKVEVEALLDQLFEEAWFDRYTRGVFLEIAFFNAQVNLFGVIDLVAEFLPTGGVETFYRIDIIRLFTYSNGFGAVRLACEILFLGFIVFFIVREINNMRRTGVKKYFKDFWNMAEWIIIACAIGATVVYFYRKYVTDNLLEEFKAAGGTQRINLQYVAYWNELLTYLLGVVVFIGTLKFIKLLRFNKRIGILSTTIGSCTKDLFHFGIMFGIFFLAYALAFYKMYARSLYDFSDFIFTLETLSAAMLGKFSYDGFVQNNRILGPIFFFFFMITITFILVNMFLTIVIEAFSSVKRDITRQSNDYEMVDFMIGQLKKWVGLNNKPKSEEKKPNAVTEKDNHDPMSEFPEKVDQLLDCIAKVYFDASQFEEVIRGMGGSKGDNPKTTKKRMILTG
ncbi:polycystic kidney disease protein 1-like 2 [Strongylocentrotus purpuratus]|uniref:PLAT domain-containing protein n=1 Tax=Strongylocentrotus purpuratus TaxID=7668 RepID=A0A7M7NUH7_STRPU|nr:polycystic kidney disease protein 1-like 2 [Strongylocentrotus purpuratus]